MLAAQYVYILSIAIVYMLFIKLDRHLFSISTETTVHLMDGLSRNFVFSDSITIYKLI
jgi:hypothetical protein